MKVFDAPTADQCANDPEGPVALTFRQKLIPVEGADSIVFPPTYADIGYNIDTLSDGTKVATIDSVGSQSNRLEPLFKPAEVGDPPNAMAELIPQIRIMYDEERGISILDAGHRLGDATDKEKVQQDVENNAAATKNTWAQRGFAHIPAPGQQGGIVVHGEIRRDVTINLIALRRLRGQNLKALRRYILGLMLAVATKPMDGFLRQGCLLTEDPSSTNGWQAVQRNGKKIALELGHDSAMKFARGAAQVFGVDEARTEFFSPKLAQADAQAKA